MPQGAIYIKVRISVLNSDQVGLIFEFAPLGNLKLHLKRYEAGEISSGLMIDFARQIATGMKYAASQNASYLITQLN